MAQWLRINQRLLVNFTSVAHSRSQFYNPHVVESGYQNQPLPELIGLLLPAAQQTREIASVQVANVLAGLMLPALDAVIRVETFGIATHRITLMAIALTRYKLQQNRYPNKLSAIQGIHLDELPTDPFTGRPLKYQRLPQGFAVYSFGGNMTDDQGLSRADAKQTNSEADDIIFRVGNKMKQPDRSQ